MHRPQPGQFGAELALLSSVHSFSRSSVASTEAMLAIAVVGDGEEDTGGAEGYGCVIWEGRLGSGVGGRSLGGEFFAGGLDEFEQFGGR